MLFISYRPFIEIIMLVFKIELCFLFLVFVPIMKGKERKVSNSQSFRSDVPIVDRLALTDSVELQQNINNVSFFGFCHFVQKIEV